MPISKPQSPQTASEQAQQTAKHRRMHPVFKVAIVLVCIALVDIAATWAFMPYASLGAISWDAFRKADYAETVVVGSSYAQRGFDPEAMDSVMGTTTYSIATPGESLSDTRSTIEEAIKKKGVRRIVYGLGYESFTFVTWVKAHVPYLVSRLDGAPITQRIAAFTEFMFSPEYFGTTDSLNCLFPFVYNPVTTPSGVIGNIKAQVEGKSRIEAAEGVIPDWHYLCRGYGNYARVFDVEHDSRTSTGNYGKTTFKQPTLDELANICRICRENDVEIYVVATPHPAFDILGYGDTYPQAMPQIQSIVEQNGGTYYDFSMAKHELLSLNEKEFGDFEHLNFEGATKFSKALAQTILKHESGQDTSGDFFAYDDWGSYLDSIDWISSTSFDIETNANGLTIHCHASTGPHVKTEYQILTAPAGDGEYHVIRDWSDDPSYVWRPDESGVYKVRVNARVAGSQAEQGDAWFEMISVIWN